MTNPADAYQEGQKAGWDGVTTNPYERSMSCPAEERVALYPSKIAWGRGREDAVREKALGVPWDIGPAEARKAAG